MFTATEAHRMSTLAEDSLEWASYDIASLIQSEAVKGKLHCDWYSNRLIYPDEKYIEGIKDIICALERYGYTCRMAILEPTKEFKSRVLRIHISWENI